MALDLLSPPRRTGEDNGDIIGLYDYFNDLYLALLTLSAQVRDQETRLAAFE